MRLAPGRRTTLQSQARGSLARMAGELIYAFRIMRLPLLDAGGNAIGRLDDIVVIPGAHGGSPRVLGFVATSQRRRIFVNANRMHSLDSDGARLRSWDVDLNPFKPRQGETMVGRDIIDVAGVLTERYDGQPGTVYLLRPDQHVAARWRSFDAGKIEAALRRCLSL